MNHRNGSMVYTPTGGQAYHQSLFNESEPAEMGGATLGHDGNAEPRL